MTYKYILALVDTVSQESIHIWITGDEQLARVQKARPEHHVISSLQNLGDLLDADDYIKEQEGK